MKKLVLIAGAAALVFPVAAHANNSDSRHTTTYKKADVHWNKDRNYDNGYRVDVQSEQDFRAVPRNTTFDTVAGEKLQISDNSVYKIDGRGNRFFAPTGSYPTRGGNVIVVEDGQFIRLEKPAEVVTMDARR